jgi:hypothetical protein
MFLTGLPSFGKSIVGWTAASIGLCAISSIMVGATERLEQRQEGKYGGQPMYEQWKTQVPSALLPFIRTRGASS